MIKILYTQFYENQSKDKNSRLFFQINFNFDRSCCRKSRVDSIKSGAEDSVISSSVGGTDVKRPNKTHSSNSTRFSPR